jgi:hypothetical protein
MFLFNEIGLSTPHIRRTNPVSNALLVPQADDLGNLPRIRFAIQHNMNSSSAPRPAGIVPFTRYLIYYLFNLHEYSLPEKYKKSYFKLD